MLAKSQEVIFRLQGNNFVDYITSTFFLQFYISEVLKQTLKFPRSFSAQK